MYSKVIHILLVAVLFLGGTAWAGSVSLTPTDFANIATTAECNESGFACCFDFSAVPTGAVIDVAELRLEINTDTTLGRKVLVGAIVATSQWNSAQNLSLSDIDISDSLAVGYQSYTGSAVDIEINITPLASLWHSGEVSNRGLVVMVYGIDGATLSVTEDAGVAEAALVVRYSL